MSVTRVSALAAKKYNALSEQEKMPYMSSPQQFFFFDETLSGRQSDTKTVDTNTTVDTTEKVPDTSDKAPDTTTKAPDTTTKAGGVAPLKNTTANNTPANSAT